MSKKHKFKKPQRRDRQKKTVGRLTFTDVVYLDKETVDGVDRVFAACTCDRWRSSAEATTILKVAKEAQEHVQNGPCQLRSHDVPDEMVDVDESEVELREENVD